MEKFLKKKDTKGITLIALVITIIVLLILAGVTINSIVNQNSSMDKAAQARLENKRAEAKDAASLVVTELIQEYYEKRFIDTTSNASCPGEYVEEVLEEEDKTSGPYIISVESEILQVEDEDDVLATGIVEDSGAILWDGTPRAVTASVNPWNNLATENDVAPADWFYYEIIDDPVETGKVDGVEEKAKVADNSGNIKVADAETENYGTAKITGINVNKLAEAYSSEDYNKTYEAKNYDSYDWNYLYEKFNDAGIIGESNTDEPSGTYYYDVSGSGPISINSYIGNLESDWYDSSNYQLRYDYFWEEIQQCHPDYIDREWNSDSSYYINNYASSVAENIYNNNQGTDWLGYDEEKEKDIYENYWYDNNGNEIWRCGESYSRNEIITIIVNYIQEHSEDFKTELVGTKFYNNTDDYVHYIYYKTGTDNRYFTLTNFSTYLISEYSNQPSYIEKFVFPSIYEDESTGKKYKIVSIDLSEYSGRYCEENLIPYVGNKMNKIYIPNSVTSVYFGYGNSYFRQHTYADTILIPGGLGQFKNFNNTFANGISVNTVVFGEGITQINANALSGRGITDVYLPKSLTNITGNWNNNINVHYAGKKGAWSRVTGNKPKAEKVTFKSVYTNSNN